MPQLGSFLHRQTPNRQAHLQAHFCKRLILFINVTKDYEYGEDVADYPENVF